MKHESSTPRQTGGPQLSAALKLQKRVSLGREVLETEKQGRYDDREMKQGGAPAARSGGAVGQTTPPLACRQVPAMAQNSGSRCRNHASSASVDTRSQAGGYRRAL